MRKFTTLFLLAFAMTVGANQAFAAQTGGPNDPDGRERPERERPEKTDKDDPVLPASHVPDFPCEQAPAAFECPPPKPKKVVVHKEPEDCGCKHKTMRVGARFVTVTDCYYQTISVNGRAQIRYCTKDD